MPVQIEANSPRELRNASFIPRARPFASPADWRDQILYFLLPDRFSDGREHLRPQFNRAQPAQFRASDKAAWMNGGRRFQGGTIQGIRSKLPYLKALGATTIWVGPVWKQRTGFDDYHGYGIQNFLEVDQRFGTRQDLRDLVDAAHDAGLYVLLDIIYNHSGNNWFYRDFDGSPKDDLSYRFRPVYDIHGWRTQDGRSLGAPVDIEDGVWPDEFQNPNWYTRAGKIGRWDPQPWEDPRHPDNEFRRGDFGVFKDLRLGENEPNSQEVLRALIDVYRYWIALTDCDGFRIDTCKHVPEEASRHFCGGIREYAESIGKENFLLLGEVAGGAAMARNYIEIFGKNLDAALDLGEPPKILAAMVKGLGTSEFNPVSAFFAQFGGHDAIGSHREVGRYHVSVLDDHDMIGRSKARFTNAVTPHSDMQAAHAVGVQLTTLGIPCIYYGTEQAFDGREAYHDDSIEARDSHGKIPYDDRYIRESMFGGTFGAFQTTGCHFFDQAHPTYLRIAAIAALVRTGDPVGRALRRGRQYPRQINTVGAGFEFSRPGEIVAWSRIFLDTEVLVALNSHGVDSRGAAVTVDARLHPSGSQLRILYRSDWTDQELTHSPPAQTLTVAADANGRAFVRVDLPPAGMLIAS